VERARAAWRQVRSAAVCYLALLAEVIVFGSLNPDDLTVLSYVAADVATLVIIVAFAWPTRREIIGLFRLPRMDAVAWTLVVLGPVGLWLFNEGLVFTISDLPGVLVSNPVLDLRRVGASERVVFLLVCVTPPLLEETAFRGVILENIREPFGTRPAAIVVSVLFSILHLAALSFVPFAALALVLAALRFRTGSLWPSIAGHGLFNLATLLLGSGNI
jgi:membrane protease YdiL (CAAX protease family)